MNDQTVMYKQHVRKSSCSRAPIHLPLGCINFVNCHYADQNTSVLCFLAWDEFDRRLLLLIAVTHLFCVLHDAWPSLMYHCSALLNYGCEFTRKTDTVSQACTYRALYNKTDVWGIWSSASLNFRTWTVLRLAIYFFWLSLAIDVLIFHPCLQNSASWRT